MKDIKSPEHIAIIMDGNRRWAKEHKLPIVMGHKKGAETIKKIVEYCNNIGLKYITVYAFSTENWKRSEEEVSALMTLLKNYLDEYLKEADSKNIKVNVLGDISVLREDLQRSIKAIQDKTANNTGTNFNVAINYGGRAEILNAIKQISEKVKKDEIKIEDINEDVFSNFLYTANIPDPDLLIRTSGELRLSGFLLWQASYTELLFMDKYWPEFNTDDLDMAIEEYKKRNRKFGAN